ncbi:ribonuclease Y [bacterium]|nr:ribonuclease Y [bacterium]
MDIAIFILSGLVIAVAAFIFGQLYATKIRVAKRIREAEDEAKTILNSASVDAENLKKEKLIEVSDEWYRKKQDFDEQTKAIRAQTKNQQDELLKRERNIEQKGDLVTRKEKDFLNREQLLHSKMEETIKKNEQLDAMIKSENEKLEQMARMSAEDAKRVLMSNMTEKAKQESAQAVRNIKEQAQLTAKEQIKNVLLQAINRTSMDHTIETTVTSIKLPSNEMKGRIIGREGRNIRAFETITGCEILIDDTPNTIVISGFDPIRREIAKMALESLITDGRIHPGRIEDVVEKAKRDLDELIISTGEEALFEVSIHGTHIEIVKLLGKLKYRTQHGLNLLQHSIETATIAGLIAAELGFDVQLAKRAAILHDIGFAVDRTDQHHAAAGADVARKYGENATVQLAILLHHENPTTAHPIAVIVSTANMLSKERPGSQKNALENYLKRLHKLEEIALSFPGVLKAYAIQAGREIRVLVDFNVLDDNKMMILADDITRKIESELEYPGQVKITVIREYRAVDVAK